LTYERAVESAKGVEMSKTNLREISTPKPVTVQTEPVHKAVRERGSSAKTAKNPVVCSRCGTEGHPGSACRFKDKQCNFCKKKEATLLGCAGRD